MKTIHLTLTKKWFDMILSGEKPEEYREIKHYWCKRLLKLFWWDETIDRLDCKMPTATKRFDFVEFRNGYSKDAPTMTVECKGITTGIGNPSWGAPSHPVFIIKLGDIMETKNIERL